LTKSDGPPERQEILAAAGFTGDMNRAEILKRASDDLGWLSSRLVGLTLLREALGETASLEALAQLCGPASTSSRRRRPRWS
jgi:hypothetical protein